MKPSFEEIKQELKLRNINLSHQRLKVLEYLVHNQYHPTVDQIFTALQKEIWECAKISDSMVREYNRDLILLIYSTIYRVKSEIAMKNASLLLPPNLIVIQNVYGSILN